VESRDVAPQTEGPEDLGYEPPEVVELGSFEELTHGGRGGGPDFADRISQ